MVGNLGERAPEVGADPLLVRVGAYYHDIGKLKRPYFFVENQAGGENVHETLEPEVSATSCGLRPRRRRAVRAVRRAAGRPGVDPQHHGTRLVSFFYDQAVDAAHETASSRPIRPASATPAPVPRARRARF